MIHLILHILGGALLLVGLYLEIIIFSKMEEEKDDGEDDAGRK